MYIYIYVYTVIFVCIYVYTYIYIYMYNHGHPIRTGVTLIFYAPIVLFVWFAALGGFGQRGICSNALEIQRAQGC